MAELLEMVRKHGVELRKAATTKGGEYQGSCPHCGGKDRFHVWPFQNEGKGSYWCRQCGRAGDPIQFLRDFEGLSFHQACDRLGIKVPDSRDLKTPEVRGTGSFEAKEHRPPEEVWQEKARKFIHWAYEQLFECPEVLEYLGRRGIREETAGRLGLGWNPGKGGKDLFRAREGWGLSIERKKNGKRRALWLPVGMVIPCMNGERFMRIRIRRPGELEFGPRYYIVPGSSMETMVLVNPGQGFERMPYIVVESELDGILLAQEAGDMAGVVAVGSSSAKPSAAVFEKLKKSPHILNALDFDEAGAEARHWWDKHFPDSERWPVPEGKDPGEAFEAGVNLREWVKAGLPAGLIGGTGKGGENEK